MRHADPIVLDGEALGILVERNPNREGIRRERRIGQRLIAQFLASIGGVGKQFAQENVAIGIDRMHHEMQQFGDIRLKCLRLKLDCDPSASGIFQRLLSGSRLRRRIWRFCGLVLIARHRPSRHGYCRLRPPDARPSCEFFACRLRNRKKSNHLLPAPCRKSVKRMLAPPPIFKRR